MQNTSMKKKSLPVGFGFIMSVAQKDMETKLPTDTGENKIPYSLPVNFSPLHTVINSLCQRSLILCTWKGLNWHHLVHKSAALNNENVMSLTAGLWSFWICGEEMLPLLG